MVALRVIWRSFFGEVLKRPLEKVDALRAKRTTRLLVVLSREEVRSPLDG